MAGRGRHSLRGNGDSDTIRVRSGRSNMETTEERDLDQLYNAAEYAVDDGALRFVIRIGELSDELDALLQEAQCDSWAFISAHNPRSTELTKSENDARHGRFLLFLDEKGYRYFAGYGQSPDGSWTPETSLLIIGIDRDEAVRIGRKFEQHAVLAGRGGFPPELVWCD